jgi:hypothetical protein
LRWRPAGPARVRHPGSRVGRLILVRQRGSRALRRRLEATAPGLSSETASDPAAIPGRVAEHCGGGSGAPAATRRCRSPMGGGWRGTGGLARLQALRAWRSERPRGGAPTARAAEAALWLMAGVHRIVDGDSVAPPGTALGAGEVRCPGSSPYMGRLA